MSNYSKENYDYMKQLIGKGIFKDEFFRKCFLSADEVQTIFCAFRSQKYRIFETEVQGFPYYAPKEAYMQLNNISGKIETEHKFMRILLMSDDHCGSIYDNPYIMHMIYDYCAATNIHNIIHMGDLLEGNDYHILHKDENKLRYSISESNQMAYLERYIPHDDNIKIYILEGNHDLFSNSGIANDVIYRYIKQYNRNDIQIVGYDLADLCVNNGILHLNHGAISDPYKLDNLVYTVNMVLSGHSHMTDWIICDGYPKVIEKKISSTSNIKHGDDLKNNFTGFSTLEVYFDNYGDFQTLIFKDYKIDDCMYTKPVCIGNKHIVNTRRLTRS